MSTTQAAVWVVVMLVALALAVRKLNLFEPDKGQVRRM